MGIEKWVSNFEKNSVQVLQCRPDLECGFIDDAVTPMSLLSEYTLQSILG
jgi:hypothetical protein